MSREYNPYNPRNVYHQKQTVLAPTLVRLREEKQAKEQAEKDYEVARAKLEKFRSDNLIQVGLNPVSREIFETMGIVQKYERSRDIEENFQRIADKFLSENQIKEKRDHQIRFRMLSGIYHVAHQNWQNAYEAYRDAGDFNQLHKPNVDDFIMKYRMDGFAEAHQAYNEAYQDYQNAKALNVASKVAEQQFDKRIISLISDARKKIKTAEQEKNLPEIIKNSHKIIILKRRILANVELRHDEKTPLAHQFEIGKEYLFQAEALVGFGKEHFKHLLHMNDTGLVRDVGGWALESYIRAGETFNREDKRVLGHLDSGIANVIYDMRDILDIPRFALGGIIEGYCISSRAMYFPFIKASYPDDVKKNLDNCEKILGEVINPETARKFASVHKDYHLSQVPKSNNFNPRSDVLGYVLTTLVGLLAILAMGAVFLKKCRPKNNKSKRNEQRELLKKKLAKPRNTDGSVSSIELDGNSSTESSSSDYLRKADEIHGPNTRPIVDDASSSDSSVKKLEEIKSIDDLEQLKSRLNSVIKYLGMQSIIRFVEKSSLQFDQTLEGLRSESENEKEICLLIRIISARNGIRKMQNNKAGKGKVKNKGFYGYLQSEITKIEEETFYIKQEKLANYKNIAYKKQSLLSYNSTISFESNCKVMEEEIERIEKSTADEKFKADNKRQENISPDKKRAKAPQVTYTTPGLSKERRAKIREEIEEAKANLEELRRDQNNSAQIKNFAYSHIIVILATTIGEQGARGSQVEWLRKLGLRAMGLRLAFLCHPMFLNSANKSHVAEGQYNIEETKEIKEDKKNSRGVKKLGMFENSDRLQDIAMRLINVAEKILEGKQIKLNIPGPKGTHQFLELLSFLDKRKKGEKSESKSAEKPQKNKTDKIDILILLQVYIEAFHQLVRDVSQRKRWDSLIKNAACYILAVVSKNAQRLKNMQLLKSDIDLNLLEKIDAEAIIEAVLKANKEIDAEVKVAGQGARHTSELVDRESNVSKVVAKFLSVLEFQTQKKVKVAKSKAIHSTPTSTSDPILPDAKREGNPNTTVGDAIRVVSSGNTVASVSSSRPKRKKKQAVSNTTVAAIADSITVSSSSSADVNKVALPTDSKQAHIVVDNTTPTSGQADGGRYAPMATMGNTTATPNVTIAPVMMHSRDQSGGQVAPVTVSPRVVRRRTATTHAPAATSTAFHSASYYTALHALHAPHRRTTTAISTHHDVNMLPPPVAHASTTTTIGSYSAEHYNLIALNSLRQQQVHPRAATGIYPGIYSSYQGINTPHFYPLPVVTTQARMAVDAYPTYFSQNIAAWDGQSSPISTTAYPKRGR